MRSTPKRKNLLLGSKFFLLRVDSLKREAKIKMAELFPSKVHVPFQRKTVVLAHGESSFMNLGFFVFFCNFICFQFLLFQFK